MSSARKLDDERLKVAIKATHERRRGTYGPENGISYVATVQGWLYMAGIKDLWNKEIVGDTYRDESL